MNARVDHWFVAKVLPLEAELDSFLRHHLRGSSDVADVRQDVLVRVYKAAETDPPGNPRAFVYAVARNLLIDRFRRERIVSIEHVMDLDALHVPTEEAGPFEAVSARQELAMLQAALQSLPERTRAIVSMRRIQGLSQKETAKTLGVSEPTVERHVSRGVRLLAEALKSKGVARPGLFSRTREKGRLREP